MTFDLADDPWEVMEVDPPLWTSDKEFRAATHETSNVRWAERWPLAVTTKDRKKPGHVVYKLQAPKGKRLRKVTIDLGGSLRWRQSPEDKVSMSIAEGLKGQFKQVCDLYPAETGVLDTGTGRRGSDHYGRPEEQGP